MIYKKKGGTSRVTVRRKDMLDVSYVQVILKQAGLSQAEIEKFIATTATRLH
jgi:hypothetical protein